MLKYRINYTTYMYLILWFVPGVFKTKTVECDFTKSPGDFKSEKYSGPIVSVWQPAGLVWKYSFSLMLLYYLFPETLLSAFMFISSLTIGLAIALSFMRRKNKLLLPYSYFVALGVIAGILLVGYFYMGPVYAGKTFLFSLNYAVFFYLLIALAIDVYDNGDKQIHLLNKQRIAFYAA